MTQVRYIGKQPIYMQTPRYVEYGWPAPPKIPNPDWPLPPVLEGYVYRITSPHWNGEIRVNKILLDEFGEARAVPFTVWGYMLKLHAHEWEPLFERYGRHEVRKQFIESIKYKLIFDDALPRSPIL